MMITTLTYDHVICQHLLTPIGRLATHEVLVSVELNNDTKFWYVRRITFKPETLGVVLDVQKLLADINNSAENHVESSLAPPEEEIRRRREDDEELENTWSEFVDGFMSETE
jgi:hypothetical protein